MGWLGTASTGSDTSANVFFGSLQSMTARQIGVSPILMASANSAGGVMGKTIAARSVEAVINFPTAGAGSQIFSSVPGVRSDANRGPHGLVFVRGVDTGCL